MISNRSLNTRVWGSSGYKSSRTEDTRGVGQRIQEAWDRGYNWLRTKDTKGMGQRIQLAQDRGYKRRVGQRIQLE